MENNYEILEKCPLFRDIKREDLDAMLTCLGASIRHFDKSAVIFHEGSDARYMGIVLSGAAQLERVDYNGNRSIIMKLMPSEMMAEAFACSDLTELPIEIVAAEDSDIMLINAERIRRTCSNAFTFHSQMIYNLLQAVSIKNITLNQKIEITSKRNTREKLMAYLMMEAKKRKSSTFTIPYDRQELADYLEVDRSGLSAEISRMKKEGLIDCSRSRFTVK